MCFIYNTIIHNILGTDVPITLLFQIYHTETIQKCFIVLAKMKHLFF